MTLAQFFQQGGGKTLQKMAANPRTTLSEVTAPTDEKKEKDKEAPKSEESSPHQS